MEKQHAKQWAEENEEKIIGAIVVVLLKEEHMEVCHLHDALCLSMFVRNATKNVEYVSTREIGHIKENVLLVQLL